MAAAAASSVPEEGSKEVFNANVNVDIDKAKEVEIMEQNYGKRFPFLKRRFQSAVIYTNPVEVLSLILEVVEIMLLPLEAFKGREAIVLMGITGAGKSTFGNWLLGKTMTIISKSGGATADSDSEDDDAQKAVSCDAPAFRIGHGMASMTFAPNVFVEEGGGGDEKIVVDFPGFADTNGFEIRIGMDLAFRTMCEWMKPLHVVSLIPIGSFEAGRGTLLRQQLSKISRLLPPYGAPVSTSHTANFDEACTWKVGITKCDKNFEKGAREKFAQAVQTIIDIDASLADKIIHVNEEMFGTKKKSPADPAEFQQQLLSSTWTPTKPPTQPTLVKAVEECFPSQEFMQRVANDSRWSRVRHACKSKLSSTEQSFLPSLVSDCLNTLDCEALAKNLSTYEMFDAVFMEDDVSPDSLNATLGKSPTWQDAVKAIKNSSIQLSNLAQRIVFDSENLVKGNILSVERRVPQIHELCRHRQPRLKKCFHGVEEKVLTAQMTMIQLAKETAEKNIKQLYDKGCIRSGDFEQLKQKIVEVDASFKKDVESLGWTDVGKFAQVGVGVLGIASAAGSVGMLAHVSLTSTSLGAWLGGTGTWASISAGATAGLATGGILLGVAAVGGLAYFGTSWLRSEGDQASKEIRIAMCESLDKLMEAHTKAADHKKKLDAIRSKLQELEVIAKD